MIYAQVQAGFIVNVISLDDPTIVNLFYINPVDGSKYDFVKQIDNLQPCVPQISWSYQPPIYPALGYYTSQDGSDLQVEDTN